MKTIILTGKPISTQNAYRRRAKWGMMMTKVAKETKESYIKQVRKQRNNCILEGELEINIRLVFGDKLRRDRDNRHKISMDAMEGIVFEDDRQIKKATVEMFYKPKEFYIEIEINAKVCEDSIG